MGSNTAFSLPTLLILAPAAFGFIALAMGTRRASGLTSLIAAVVQTALLVLGVVMASGHSVSHVVSSQHTAWFSSWGISYDVAADAPALGLVALTTLVVISCATFACWSDRDRPAALQG